MRHFHCVAKMGPEVPGSFCQLITVTEPANPDFRAVIAYVGGGLYAPCGVVEIQGELTEQQFWRIVDSFRKQEADLSDIESLPSEYEWALIGVE